QMERAKYDTLNVKILNNDYLFRATGSRLVFPGFLKVYSFSDQNNKDTNIPELKPREKLAAKDIIPNQHFTKPPARYTEASLIKTLEELGIGRPSTYSPTIGTILARDYVSLENRSLYPTELGILVNDLLTEHFKEVVNEEFTAELENNLDLVAEESYPWKKV